MPVPHRKAPTEAGAETGANSLPAGEPHRTSRPVLGLFFLSRRSRLGPTSILLPPPKNNSDPNGPSCYFLFKEGFEPKIRAGQQTESQRASRVRGFAIFVVEVLVPLRYNVFIKTKT